MGDSGWQWFVVHTHVRRETLALAHLRRQQFETFLPMIHTRTPGGHLALRPLFPRYLFVQFDPDIVQWRPICSTYGVKRLISTDAEHPVALPFGTVESLKDQVVALDLPEPFPDGVVLIDPGTTVVVKRGPLVGHEGICLWSDGRRTRLLMQVMGGSVQVTFSRSAIEQKG